MFPCKFPGDPKPEDVTFVYALRACLAGNASADQQQRVIKYVINDLCGVLDPSFSAEAGVMQYREGMRAVGLFLTDVLNNPAITQILNRSRKEAQDG